MTNWTDFGGSGQANALDHSDLPLGSVIPRIWTKPLISGPPGLCGCGCAFTRETTYGFSVIDFAERIVKLPLDPWERWLVIHAGELLPDNRPRFREVLVLVARQNGKTTLLKILTLWWLFVDMAALVLGVSSKVEYAREVWESAIKLARRTPRLAADIPRNAVRSSNGQETFTTTHDTRYKIAAATDDAGRSLTVHRLIMDELRRQYDWTAYNAASNTVNAVIDGQTFMLSNQGDLRSVVLHSLRKSCMKFIEKGVGNPRFGLFEWSAPKGADPEDVIALAQANPNVGRRIDWGSLLGTAARVKAAGGKELSGFQIEVMCMEVDQLDPAIDAHAWRTCATGGDLGPWRDRIAACLDISLDGEHAALVAAAKRDDGVVVVDVVKAWSGKDCGRAVARDLPALLVKIRAQVFCWFPNGPAASIAPDLAKRPAVRGQERWPPRGCEIVEVRGDATDACMGLEELVRSSRLSHGDDDLLNSHSLSADRLPIGEKWRFTRLNAGHCNAAYAAAGAAQEARRVRPRRRLSAVGAAKETPEA